MTRPGAEDGNDQPHEQAGNLAEGGDDAEPEHAEAGDDQHQGGQHDADNGEPGDELAVDHIVTMDGLGDETRQRALRSLPTDSVETERDPEDRRQKPDEGEERERHRVGRDGEQTQEQRRRTGRLRSDVTDAGCSRVDGAGRGQGQNDEQHDESCREQVVGEFLARYHSPAV